MDHSTLDNSPPNELTKKIKIIRKIFPIPYLLLFFIIVIVLPPSTYRGYIILFILFFSVIFAAEYVMYKSVFWHFSKIRYTEEGIYFYRDTVKYLPKERFIPWKKILGFTLGKNAAILTINYNPYYLFGEAKEKTPYYFMLYGIKKNPKIKEFIESRYPFLFEKYRDLIDGKEVDISKV